MRRWVEWWVSECDQYGDIIDYTGQFDGRQKKQALKEFAAPFAHAAAITKVLERVVSKGDDIDGVGDRHYTTIAERTRNEDGQ